MSWFILHEKIVVDPALSTVKYTSFWTNNGFVLVRTVNLDQKRAIPFTTALPLPIAFL